jgi:hypothetical protein
MKPIIVLTEISAALVLAGSIFIPTLVWGNTIEDTHRFRLGIYEQDIDVTGTATRDPLPEISLDFDKVLGMEDSSQTIFLGYQWRFKEKWSLQAYYSQLDVTGKKIATKDFNFDGEEYTAGVLLESSFDLDTYLLAVSYSFVRDTKKEFGVGFGLHAFDIDSSIGAVVQVDGLQKQGAQASAEVLAPLPNIRAFGTYMINPKWEVSATGGWLSFSYEDYSGGYLFLNLYTEYRFTERFGMGFSLQVANIDVDVEDSNSKKEFEIDLYGPSIYLTYGF